MFYITANRTVLRVLCVALDHDAENDNEILQALQGRLKESQDEYAALRSDTETMQQRIQSLENELEETQVWLGTNMSRRIVQVALYSDVLCALS